MAKIVVRDIGAAAAGASEPGVETEKVVAKPVLAGTGDPIHLHDYRLAPGGRISWPSASHGRIVYVREGSIEVEGTVVAAGGCVTIEHGAAIAAAAPAGAELLAFAAVASTSGRCGGHVHILPPEDVPRALDFGEDVRAGGALLVDAGCPSCELWMHETVLHPGGSGTPVHAHSEDELIVVTEGEIILGRKTFGPGTTVAVARGTLYGFSSGPAGLKFINFRPHSPVYLPHDKRRAPIDERRFYLDRLSSPVPRTFAAPPKAA